jgi:hypothetical protein
MDRTFGANYDGSSGARLFTDGPPGTTLEQEFLNGVQEELLGSIQATSQIPSISDRTQLVQSIAMQGLGLRNGVIVPSVAGNNLTVAIKTLAGLDPSTSNPVWVRIGNYLRKITSPLYITVAGGTDDWDRTSYTFSLFVYLGWDAVNLRPEILLSAIPTYSTYPAANPAAPKPQRLRSAYGSSTGTAITNGHTMQVIGRVDGVVQSGADNFTAVTSMALSYPIYHTPILLSPEVPARTNVGDTSPVFVNIGFKYVLNFNVVTSNFGFSGDGGADGAGVLGYLVLTFPFAIDNSGAASDYSLGGGVTQAAGLDADNACGLIPNVNPGTNLFYLKALRTVAGSTVTLTCSMFTAGANRYIAGDCSYIIML